MRGSLKVSTLVLGLFLFFFFYSLSALFHIKYRPISEIQRGGVRNMIFYVHLKTTVEC